jgi:hypothetical protein
LDDVDETGTVGAELEGRKDLREALGELRRRQVLADGTDGERSSDDAVELGWQRRTRGSTPQQRHEVVEQGADAGEVEARVDERAGLRSPGGEKSGEADAAVGGDADVADRDFAVDEAGVGHDAVQGGDGDGEVGENQQALIQREVHTPVLQRRRQLGEVEPIEPRRHHERHALDDAMPHVRGEVRVAHPDQGVAAAGQLGVLPRRQTAVDLQEERPAQSGMGGLVAIGDGRTAEVVEQGEVAETRHGFER